MKTHSWKFRRRSNRAGEAGQAILLYILVLSTFLLGALLFAFDLSNMWFHRQAAQSAADAACASGAMDLLVDAQGGATGHQVFKLGQPYSCTTASSTSSPADPVCWYAAQNGYNSNSTNNQVSVSFPSSVIGVTPPPASVASTAFIRVDIVDHVPTLFAGIVGGGSTKDVCVFSTCGVEEAAVKVCGDNNAEADEVFRVLLSSPTGASLLNNQGFGLIVNDDPLQLALEESGPSPTQAAAVDSIFALRDPFRVVGIPDWFPTGTEKNTRVGLYVRNLQLNPGELPSAVFVILTASNGQFNIPAEDV